jgi:integrase
MSLYRRDDSPHWWARFAIDGREVRLSTGTEDRRAAQEFESIERAKRWRQTKLGEKPAYPWNDAKRRWLAETQKRSKATDESLFTWFDKTLAGLPVQEITRATVDKLRQLKLAEGAAEATVNRHMCLLRALLRKCERDWEVIDRAPPVPMYRTRAPEPRWLTREEFGRLVAALPPHLGLAARFAVLTGLRMRSMLALEWPHVDLAAGRAWIPADKMKGAATHGFRLSMEACDVLRELRRLSPEGGRVFQWNEQPIDDCNTLAFKRAVMAAQLDPLRWHDLRHTFASWAIQSGVTPYELMQLGAWKSLRMVERYAHLSPDHLAGAAEKVSGAHIPHKNRHSEVKRKVGRRRYVRKALKNKGGNGGAEGDRTLDLRIANATLSQLSYRPTRGRRF